MQLALTRYAQPRFGKPQIICRTIRCRERFIVPKLTVSVFVNKHKSGTCVLLQFFDFKRMKDAARKAKRPLETNEGKEIPTPSQMITKLVATFAKGDYAIQSVGEDARTGVKIQVTLKDPNEALHLVKIFHPASDARHFKPGDGKPCASGIAITVEDSDHFREANRLGLI